MTHATAGFAQNGFRFRNDDGSETTATWIDLENTNSTLTIDANTIFRVRILTQEVNGGAANNQNIALQYQLNGGTWTAIGTATSAVRLANSANVTDQEATTSQLSSGTGTFVAGVVSETATTGNITFSGNDYTENEWVVEAVNADLATNDIVHFRTTIGGATYTYNQVPDLTIIKATQYTQTLNSDSTIIVNPPNAPTNVSASDGTFSDKVRITWTKDGAATGYKIYRDTVLIDTVGDVAVYDDTGAGSPTITAGTAVASDGGFGNGVELTLSGHSVSNGTTHTYYIVATNSGGDSGSSNTDTGYTGASSIGYRWLRSAADSDANYTIISPVKKQPYYYDTDAPSDGAGRYYKCTIGFLDEQEALPYWLYPTNTTPTHAWVKVPRIEDNGFAQLKVVKTSGYSPSISNTFIFGDEINYATNAEATSANWNQYGTPLGTVNQSVGNPSPSLQGNGDGFWHSGWLSKSTFDISAGIVLEYDALTASTLRVGQDGFDRNTTYGVDNNDPTITVGTRNKAAEGSSSNMVAMWRDSANTVKIFDTGVSNHAGQWRRVTIKAHPSYAGATWWIDGTQVHNTTDTLYNHALHTINKHGHDSADYADNYVVREYASTDPSVSVVSDSSTYIVDANNSLSTELTDFQINITPADLGGLTSGESLYITYTGLVASSEVISTANRGYVDTGASVALNSPVASQISTYRIDGNGGISDPDNVWTDDANVFDGSLGTVATSGTLGSQSSNYLQGIGTNAPSSGGVITQVRFRTNRNDEYTSYSTLSTPTGGWTWAKIQGLTTRSYIFYPMPDNPAVRTNIYEAGDAGGTSLGLVGSAVDTGGTGGRLALIEIEVTHTPAINDSTPTLEFTGTDLQSDDISYNIQVNKNDSFSEGVVDSYSESNQDNSDQLGGSVIEEIGQSFLGDGRYLSSATFYLQSESSATNNVTALLYEHSGTFGTNGVPTGSPLATSDSIDPTTISTSAFELVNFTFATPYKLVSGTPYFIVLDKTTEGPGTSVLVGYDSSSSTHSGNYVVYETSWNFSDVVDLIFYVRGTGPIDATSNTDSGFNNTVDGADTDPFTSGEKISYTVQAADELVAGIYYWRVRGNSTRVYRQELASNAIIN